MIENTMFILHAVISGMYRSEQRNDNKMPALLQAPLSSVIWLCLRGGGSGTVDFKPLKERRDEGYRTAFVSTKGRG